MFTTKIIYRCVQIVKYIFYKVYNMKYLTVSEFEKLSDDDQREYVNQTLDFMNTPNVSQMETFQKSELICGMEWIPQNNINPIPNGML